MCSSLGSTHLEYPPHASYVTYILLFTRKTFTYVFPRSASHVTTQNNVHFETHRLLCNIYTNEKIHPNVKDEQENIS